MTRLQHILSKYNDPKYYNRDLIINIISHDPTTKMNGYDKDLRNVDTIKAGRYSKWLMKSYDELKEDVTEAELFIEDLYKTKDDLIKYDRFKNRLPQEERDINNIKYRDLFMCVENFSLIEATTTKSDRKGSLYHPGAEVFHEDENWLVMSISDTGEMGKEAAVFYGGNNQETRWCTSAPGLDYYARYVKDGPLFVFLNLTDTEKGTVTGLPMERYQIHFETGQFMDHNDRSFDFINFLQTRCSGELRAQFKDIFFNSLVTNDKDVIIDDRARRTLKDIEKLYGLDNFLDIIPENVESLIMRRSNANGELIGIVLDEKIYKFKKLKRLVLHDGVKEVAVDLSKLENLVFLDLSYNKNLTKLNTDIEKMEKLEHLILTGTSVPLYAEYEYYMIATNVYDFLI